MKFISNMFDYQRETIVKLYKCRWEIEVFFKQIKQNFELGYFYSDSEEGIKTQIWIALIANLIFTVIHKRTLENEPFTIMVAMAAANLGSYICFVSLIKSTKLDAHERDIRIIQLDLFEKLNSNKVGGVSEKIEKSP